MREELALCPFCDGEAELDTSQMYRALSDGALGYRAAVYCTRCGADMGFCYDDAPGTPREDIVNQVVDDWNRRAPSPDMREALALAMPSAIDELRAAIEAYEANWIALDGYKPAIATLLRIIADEMADKYPDDTNNGRASSRSLTGAKP